MVLVSNHLEVLENTRRPGRRRRSALDVPVTRAPDPSQACPAAALSWSESRWPGISDCSGGHVASGPGPSSWPAGGPAWARKAIGFPNLRGSSCASTQVERWAGIDSDAGSRP